MLLEIVLRTTGLLSTHYERQGGTYISQFNQVLHSWYLTEKPYCERENTTNEFTYRYSFDRAGIFLSY